jgi:hypothetical protein
MLENAAHTGLSEDVAHGDEELGASESSRAVDFADVEDRGSNEAREQPPKRKKKRFGLGKKKESYSHTHYKVYKRRWIGLGQLVLLNIVVSWDVSSRAVPFTLLLRGGCIRVFWRQFDAGHDE